MLQQQAGLALRVWLQLPCSLPARLVGSLGFGTLPRALLTSLASSMLQASDWSMGIAWLVFAVLSTSSLSLLIRRSYLWDCKCLASNKIFPAHSIFCPAKPCGLAVVITVCHGHAVPEQHLGRFTQSHGLNWSQLKVMEVGIKPGEHMEYLGTKVSPVRQNYTAKLKKVTSAISVEGLGMRMGQMSRKERISGLDYSAAGRQLMPLHVLILQVPSKVWTMSEGRLTWTGMSCIFKLELMTKEKKKESVRITA